MMIKVKYIFNSIHCLQDFYLGKWKIQMKAQWKKPATTIVQKEHLHKMIAR